MNQLLNKYEFFCILLQEDVAKELGIPVECQRFWLWAKRQNHTYRPNRPLTEQEEAQTVW
jgi:ubiquitin carboxyl-terminal hydrolase 7